MIRPQPWFHVLWIITILFPTNFGLASELNIEDWLGRPGVKMLAVEFYASWCKPCVEAIPKWKTLHEKYKQQGLRLIVVATRDASNTCVNPGWNPDAIICDDDGYLSDRYGAKKLPAGFLWSWQGDLLARATNVDEIDNKITQWMQQTPRIEVQALSITPSADISKQSLVSQLRSEFKRTDKITIVATEAERRQLRKIVQKTLKITSDSNLACEVGQEITANSLLRASITEQQKLQLQLFSAEKACLVQASSAHWNKLNPETSIAEAVHQLIRKIKRPSIQVPWITQLQQSKTKPISDYQKKLARARELTKKAEELKRIAVEEKQKHIQKVNSAWQAVAEIAQTTAMPQNERIQTLQQFLFEYPDDNPYKTKAKTYLDKLQSGQEIIHASSTDETYIPAGFFHMGCVPSNDSCGDEEKPRHKVYLDAYYIDKTEVTVAAYKKCVDAGRCKPTQTRDSCNWNKQGKSNHPVNCVNWHQAKSYCSFKGKNLPTEAQWEKAARTKDDDIYPWGSKPPDNSLALFNKNWDYGTQAVNARPAINNIYGMAGNVGEWVLDCYNKDIYKRRKNSRNPLHSPSNCLSRKRVLRGGSFSDYGWVLRSSSRLRNLPITRNRNVGFRCARPS